MAAQPHKSLAQFRTSHRENKLATRISHRKTQEENPESLPGSHAANEAEIEFQSGVQHAFKLWCATKNTRPGV